MESILTSIKKLLGIQEDYEQFDADIIIYINSAFATLHQLGVGPTEPFHITGKDETWSSFIGDISNIDSVKNYVYLKVRLIFDPPTNSSLGAFQEMIKELEWRLNVAYDHSLRE